MIYPILNAKESPKSPVKAFYGLNRKKKASVGEFEDCLNINGDEFPVLASGRGNEETKTCDGEIKKILPPESGEVDLIGIVDGDITGFGTFTNENEKDKHYDKRVNDILKIGDSLITIPEFTVYNTTTLKCKYKPSDMYTVLEADGSETKEKIISDKKGSYTIKCSIDKTLKNKKIAYLCVVLIVGGQYILTASEDDYIVIDSIKTSEFTISYYKKNESGKFEKTTNEELENIEKENLFYGLTDSVFITQEADVSIACVHNNRVWGVTSDGRQIRCSKLGEPNVFNDYDDGAASSWYTEVGSEGKFVGIIPYNNAIFAFKENAVHVVYGTIPQNFSLEKTFDECGCIDGKSIIVVNNVLYWLGYNGIYRYAGGVPKVISDNLNRKYKKCVSISDNEKIYFNLTDFDGESELISYDTKNGIWHKHTHIDFLGGFLYGGELYSYTENAIYKMFSGGFGDWKATFALEYEDNLKNASTTQVKILFEMKKESHLKVEYKGISESDWEEAGTFTASEDMVGCEHFVLRKRNDSAYNLRLSGSGEVYIYEMLKTTPSGGYKQI